MDHSADIADALFTGDPRHALDAKNRLALPARWFKKGEDQKEFYALKHPRRPCLSLYPPAVFRRMLDLAVEKIHDPDEQQDVRRDLASTALIVTTDKQRRIVLSEALCRAAGLDGEVNLVGNTDRIEVWDAQVWTRHKTERAASLAEKTRHVPL